MPLRSSVTVISALVILPCREEMAPVISARRPGPVLADVDGDLDRPLGRLPAVPLHGDEPLLVEHVLDHGQAIARVHGQPAAARDEAHDAVAGHRRAALARSARAGRPRRGSGPRPRSSWPPSGRLGSGRAAPCSRTTRGRELAQHLVDGGLAVADGRPAGRRPAGSPARRGASSSRRRRAASPGTRRYFLASRSNSSRPELERAGALLDLEPLVDLGARRGWT